MFVAFLKQTPRKSPSKKDFTEYKKLVDEYIELNLLDDNKLFFVRGFLIKYIKLENHFWLAVNPPTQEFKTGTQKLVPNVFSINIDLELKLDNEID